MFIETILSADSYTPVIQVSKLFVDVDVTALSEMWAEWDGAAFSSRAKLEIKRI